MRQMSRIFMMAAGVAGASLGCLPLSAALAATLPVPCAASACANSKFGAGAAGFVSAGSATASQAGSKLTVHQTSTNVTLNWQSFNISADGKVQFVQPSATAVALNQINDVNPSQIFGGLNANGRVFLLNQNGIIFGPNAQVNVGGLVASTLNIKDTAVTEGLLAPGSQSPGMAAFQGTTKAGVTIEPGASLQTADGGQILIFAPTITNQGTISTPDGQTILAAGNTIYLASSTDPSLRGLLVQVGGTGGTVTNGTSGNANATTPESLVGQIIAARGNVTLAGMAVNQLGRVSATTSINKNGSIYLQANDGGTINGSGATGVSTTVPGTGGQLTLGAHSDTEVTLDAADPATTVDSVPQLKSKITLTGATVDMLDGSVARATSGAIDITAAQSANETPQAVDASRFYLAPDAVLDVSGADVVLPVSSNVIPVQLRGAELANSPLQQSGPLRSQTVYVDIRQGTPLADVSGEIAAIGHNVLERNLAGGTISISSHGDAILAPDSQVDVAGGQIQYTAGYLDTSQLITATGQIVDIGVASPNVLYKGIANTTTVSDPKWGVTNSYAFKPATFAPGYVEGKDAGSVTLVAPQFVWDGNVEAGTVAGMYQRVPGPYILSGSSYSTAADGTTTALYRPYNQIPQSATLAVGPTGTAIGNDFIIGSVTFASTEVLPTLKNADGSAFDPLSDPLPASYAASVLRPELLGGAQGFGNVTLYANGAVTEPAGVKLQLPSAGSLQMFANTIELDGVIDVPGGTITAVAEPTSMAYSDSTLQPYALTLGPQASLITAGSWVNDSPILYPNGNSAPLVINGGSVSLTALSTDDRYSPGVALAPGSLIDVSGGAHLSSAGTLTAGTGGKISIGAQFDGAVTNSPPGASPRLELAGTLRGYGLYQGGVLSLTDAGVCIAAADCSGGDASLLWVSPTELAAGGFSAYSLTADQGGLTLAPGTAVTLRQQNLALPAGFRMLSDQTSLSALATFTELPDQLRAPVSLSLVQSEPINNFATQNPSFTVMDSTPSLSIGTGASIETDPLATISLTSNVRIEVDGALHAPAGSISLTLNAPAAEAEYNSTQAIWLGAQGVLNAAGANQIFLNGTGLRSGSVLPGGTVKLEADRGYVELLPGSLIDVAGTAGIIDEQGVGSGIVQAHQVASAGGTVTLIAAEGMQLGGAFEAAAGISAAGTNRPAGGTFSLTLDPSFRNDSYNSSGTADVIPFPSTPRQIVVSASQTPVVVAPGSEIPDSTDGLAAVSAAALQSAGFDSVSLKAVWLKPLNSAPNTTGTYLFPGSISFDGNVTLSAGLQISLDAATYSVSPGSTAVVKAPYVEFGNSDQDQYFYNVPAATPGSGTLEVDGGFIELYGNSALQGIGAARFNATGDLRLRGLIDLSQSFSTTISGSLNGAGTIDLSANQIYPSTLTQFVISTDPSSITNPTNGSIDVEAAGAPGKTPLSAGGSLTLSAGSVTQNGTVRAPIGAIIIDAASVELGPNSLTSTSADGSTIPFGTTQGGLDWVYPLPNGNNIVYGTGGVAPPAQQVTLQGAQVHVTKGAVIDVAGGGDLQAYEWISGTGGTNDVLANNIVSLSDGTSNGGRPTQFAILPGLNPQVAPNDPNISAGLTPLPGTPAYVTGTAGLGLAPGSAVYLSGTPGLPAGVYTLLPARYALLPGAFLVTEVSGYTDIQPGQSVPVLSGGSIVSGYQTVAGTAFSDSRTQGFEVVPASVVLQQAQYTSTGANAFFAAQASSASQTNSASSATSAPVPAPRLPQDAGVLALIASDALTIDGSLRTAAAAGGLGAEVDISSADILVAPTVVPTQAGQILLTTASLDALNAQTLLLGGLRTGNAIDTTAQSVEVAAGANLAAPSVLLTAQGQVSVDAGASVTATGTAPGTRSYQLTGDGAFLSVSAGAQSTVTRMDATGAAGVLTLAPGSSIKAGGAAYLEASNDVVAGGALSLSGADLAVQAPDLIIGTAPASVTGTVLGSNVLAGSGVRNLLLQSAVPIDIYGGVNVSAQNLSIDAPGLSGFGLAGDSASLSATKLFTLTNLESSPAGAAGTGLGSLTINAGTINFGGGSLALNGFGGLSLNSQNALTASANGGLITPGSLAVTASEITTGAGVDLTLDAGGPVTLSAPAHALTQTAVAGLGGSLAIEGSSIAVGTDITLPSGRVTLTTTGDGSSGSLALQAGGSISVAGVVQQFADVKLASPGGRVILASSGNLELAADSAIDVSAGSGGQGGSLTLSAPSGTVSFGGTIAGTGAAASGASFSVDAQDFGGLGTLNTLLNAAGFTGGRAVRQRGPGDLVLAAGNTLTANQVSLQADAGGVTIDGSINAAAPDGGMVTLAAMNDVTLNGAIDARATLAGQRGGSVELQTTAGALLLNSGSSINVSGAGANAEGDGAGGKVWLRAPAASVLSVLNGGDGVTLQGSIVGSTKTTLEGFSVHFNSDPMGTITATDDMDPSNTDYAGAISVMNSAGAITNALGQATNAANGLFRVVPGIEIDATTQSNGTGKLVLSSDWNLYSWLGPNGSSPGILTLRAQNGITFNASLSDGFAATSGAGAFTLPAQPTDSWSYRIVAGADFNAASPLAVAAPSAANPSADVTLACLAACIIGPANNPRPDYAPTMVRTGDGFIDVAASGNFVLANQESLLYTAGVAGSGIPLAGRTGSLQGRAYPANGGDIHIDVAGDVIGAPSDQLINAWLWTVGSPSTAPRPGPTAWTVDFRSFQQGIGALAGGNVSVTAGGDIDDLSVSIPTIGVQVGGTTFAANALQIRGGGDLTVAAGGSLLGGSYFVGRGIADLNAGGNVGAMPVGSGSTGSGLAPILALGDTTFDVTARGNLAVAEILNPSLLNRGIYQGNGGSVPYFSTYGPTSSANLTAVGGNVVLDDQSTALGTAVGSTFLPTLTTLIGDPAVLDAAPPILSVASLSGDIDISRAIVLPPAPTGNLQLFARQNIIGSTGTSGVPVQLIVSDADPSLLPSPTSITSTGIYDDILAGLSTTLPDQHATTPVQLAADQSGTLEPVRIVALNGSVEFLPATTGNEGIWSAKPVQISAGLDVVNLNLVAQNLGAADVTSVTAGRDISYPETYNESGKLLSDDNGIAVDGAGVVQIAAGRNVDLGTSAGITTRANLVNGALPALGAGISVEAGLGGGAPQYAAFISQYIAGSSQFDADVVAYMESLSGAGGLTTAQAKQQFQQLSTPLQRTFLERLFFDLLRQYGSQEAASGNGDFTGAFAAISKLFPGANPNLSAGQTNPYDGGIALYFSRIYTLQGGDISLLAPGGDINVGLATAPTSFGVNKSPSELGIVAETSGSVDAFSYSDFEVNQSRVFAADGGDILVWSTEGNIDAGRGAKTAISAPALNIVYDDNGQPTVTLRAAVAGSGIQALTGTPSILPGNVYLFAPHGVVNANDAGIVAGNLTIAATAVLGASNITVSGTSVGVPVTVTGLSASVAGAAAQGGANSNVAENFESKNTSSSSTPTADTALGWLEVFVTGLGEENCRPEDRDCLQRQGTKPRAQ